MNKLLYNRILNSIDKEIKSSITEQFNINNMNLNAGKPERNMNIFNKNIVNPYDIYKKILNREKIDKNDIKEINNIVSAIKPKNKRELKRIIHYYSTYYPNDSLNWLDVSEVTSMCKLFECNNILNDYNGDIS